MKITLCDLIGHSYQNKECKEHGDCQRCWKAKRHMTPIEYAGWYGDEPWWTWLLPIYLFSYLVQRWNRLICRIKGHDWQDEGFAGPERGCIDMVCKRCGYSEGEYWLY